MAALALLRLAIQEMRCAAAMVEAALTVCGAAPIAPQPDRRWAKARRSVSINCRRPGGRRLALPLARSAPRVSAVL
jgi:hypothetical protein